MMVSLNRINYIDIAKSFAIISVVVWHVLITDLIADFSK